MGNYYSPLNERTNTCFPLHQVGAAEVGKVGQRMGARLQFQAAASYSAQQPQSTFHLRQIGINLFC